MVTTVPSPTLLAPLPVLDPQRCTSKYVQVLAEIYHAERAALRSFVSLADPLFVRESDIFLKARNVIIRDEEVHIAELRELIAELGYAEVPEPSPGSKRLWESYVDTEFFALPIRATVGAMICLFGEGLGFAFMYHMAQATKEGTRAREVLDRNLADEVSHLRVSMQVITEAYKRERSRAAVDCILSAANFAFVARHLARDQRQLLESLGFDYFAVSGSMLRFVRDLLVAAIEDSGVAPWSESSRAFFDVTADWMFSPTAMRVGWASTYLPPPPLFSKMVKWYGQSVNWVENMQRENRVKNA